MKPTCQCFQLFPLIAAGLLLFPMATKAQEAQPEPAGKAIQSAEPGLGRIHGMLNKVRELHLAGKHEEARVITERLRAVAKNHPQVAERILNAIKEQEPPMARPQAPAAQQRPMCQPQASGAQQRPMFWNQAPGAKWRQMCRPQVPEAQARQAAKPEVSKVARIRHLRQAAMHLSAAGYGEHTAKITSEINRLEKEMNMPGAGKPPAPNEMIPRDANPRDANRDKHQPQARRGAAMNEALPIELRKLQKLIADMDARMRLLEAKANPRAVPGAMPVPPPEARE